jgi:hypothetical protein
MGEEKLVCAGMAVSVSKNKVMNYMDRFGARGAPYFPQFEKEKWGRKNWSVRVWL